MCRAGLAISLSAREYGLLEYLTMRRGQIVTRAEIHGHVDDFAAEPGSNVVDVYVGYLRKEDRRRARGEAHPDPSWVGVLAGDARVNLFPPGAHRARRRAGAGERPRRLRGRDARQVSFATRSSASSTRDWRRTPRRSPDGREGGTPPEFEDEALPEFERAAQPGFFEAWLDDGRVLARSPSLGARDLDRAPLDGDGPAFTDVALPDGRPGRAVAMRQRLRIEDAPRGGPPSDRFVTVVVAQGIEDVRETLAALSRWLWLLGLLALAAGSAATVVAVTRGLRSARVLAAEIGRRDEDDLARALPRIVPVELEPIVDKLAALFARLSASFERERRFTADVSHELRTPLAALRTILEVAASRDRDGAAYRSALADATAVVEQAQSLVQNLLLLARYDARQIEIKNQDLRLRAFVDDCWRAFAAQAARRRVTFSNDIGPAAVVVTDPDKLRIVLTNLLANAAEYTADGGAIHVFEGRGTSCWRSSTAGR